MRIGEHIGPFEIERELGSGAMGTVYQARFTRDGKVTSVALKMIAFGLLGNKAALDRFEREVSILKQLRHPHIVRILADGKYKKTPFIAMEFIDGEPLDRILVRRGGRLPWEEVVAYAKQLCDALQHAHDRGIIHRDLKPSNLMVTRDSVLKLTDFGIAKDTDVTALTGANSTIGTAAYMSPEQCKGDRDLTNKSDLYSLGIVMYELLTGKKPFTADTSIDMFLKHVNEKPIRPCRIVEDLPVWLDNLVTHLMEKNKDKRPLDATTVGRMLAEIEEKVRSGASVGAEVANARTIDRPVGAIDDADRDAARSLRTGKKKKKKTKAVPWLQRPWVAAVGIGAILLGMVALGVYIFRPESLEDAFARVERAEGSDAKLLAAADFLANHSSESDPRVDQARAIFRDARAQRTEDVLNSRFSKFNGQFKNNSEGFDEDAYKAAIAAIEAEKSGNLKRAGDLWKEVVSKQQDITPEQWKDEEAVTRTSLRWVAERRVKELLETVPQTLAKLRKQLEDDRVSEVQRSLDRTSPEARAARAIRLEQFGDAAKAKAAWDELARDTVSDPGRRTWHLAATQQAAQIALKPDADAKADRITRLRQRLVQLNEVRASLTRATTDEPVVRSDYRIGLRDVVQLYDDESDPTIVTLVQQAKVMLDAAPKK